MAGDDPQPLARLLQTGQLGKLAAEARSRRGLAERIRSLLPAEEAAHLVSAGIGNADELVLIMDSSVWAARVRFRAQGLGYQRIKVKVQPPSG